MRLVDNVKLIRRFKWHRVHTLAQLADVVDTTIRRSIHFIQILFAHAKLTRKYSRDELRSRMARLGSSIGVSPGVDWSTVSLRSTVANFDSSWVVMADRLVAIWKSDHVALRTYPYVRGSGATTDGAPRRP